jgi:cytochrome P450
VGRCFLAPRRQCFKWRANGGIVVETPSEEAMSQTEPRRAVPAHVPPHLVREYPFRRGRLSTRDAYDIVDEVHANWPEAFFVEDLYPGKSGWVFRRAEDVREIFFDTEHFTSVDMSPYAGLSGGGWNMVPVEVDPPQHSFFRGLLNPMFTPKRMAALEGDIRSHAQGFIAAFSDRGRCEFVREFGLEFPIKVFLGLMGLPLSLTKQFLTWEKGLISAGSLEEISDATNAVVDYLRAEIAERQVRPREDFISYGIAAELRGRKLTPEELLGFCFNLYVGGLDTIASHMGHQFRHLAMHPEHQALLRAEPERISDAVDELMRAYPAVTIGRICVKERQLRGVTIMPGERVNVSATLAGRDPQEYERATEVILDRKPKHVSFGFGSHLCIGIHLAKRELRIAMEEFLASVPQFRLDPDEPLSWEIGAVVQLRNLPLVWDAK